MTTQTILINGKHVSQVESCDRGLHYGDGLFETIAIVNSQPRFWQRHLARLSSGCETLMLPMVPVKLLRDEIDYLIKGKQRAVLKILLTRGCGGRGYTMPDECKPTRILSLHPWPDYPGSYSVGGVHVHLCHTQLYEDRRLSGIKHLNRLPQVMASHEWQQAACQEGFMFYPDDTLAEGTRTNIFMVKQGELLTPALNRGGVNGIMRGVVMDIAEQLGLAVRQAEVPRQELADMDEVFICNSLIGIWPVIQAGDWHWQVGNITRQLQLSVNERFDAGDPV
jgi:4-amino-4-deoxychorismate lyase